MFETLEQLLDFKGSARKPRCGAHNSHIGDAAFTEMGLGREQINIGQPLSLNRYTSGYRHPPRQFVRVPGGSLRVGVGLLMLLTSVFLTSLELMPAR
jgi:hypothetical protein